MYRLVLVVVVAGALSGCSISAQQAKDVASAALDTICIGLSPMDQTFQAYAATGKVSGRVIRIERDAVATIKAICDSRPINNPQAALKTAAAAMAALVAAESQARTQAGAS